MALLMSTKEFESSIFYSGMYLNKNILKKYQESIYYFFIGEIDNFTQEKIIEFILENKTENLSKVYGEFCIVIFDEKKQTVYCANDRCGRVLLFVSLKDGFSVSSDFWSIVHHSKFNQNDLDSDNILMEIFLSANPSNGTIFRNLCTLPNGSVGVFKNGAFSHHKYWYFRFIENNLSESDKYDAIDSEFKRHFSCIKKHNPNSRRYGLGLSGGIDSRIIPYYAAAENFYICPFIIGKARPNYALLSNDHKAALAIAKYYDLDLKFMESDSLPFVTRNEIDVQFSPLCGSQIFKTTDFSLLNIDVLLTGASGFIVGSSPFYTENRKDGFVKSVISRQADLQLKRPFYKSKKAVNYILGTNFNISKRDINDDDDIFTDRSVSDFFDIFIESIPNYEFMSDTEKLMNYAISVLGQRNKLGAFESLLNTKKNYSPYVTGMLDVVCQWTEDELYDRLIFENFVKFKLPNLSKIHSQDYKLPIDSQYNSKFSKVLRMVEYIIRGQGVMNYEKQACLKEFKNFVNDTQLQKSYISELLNCEKIYKLTLQKKISSSVLANIIKTASILKKIKL